MKASIKWVVVFRLAGWTHGKDAHGCLLAIIGNILHDGEARTTVGAVDEGIPEASIVGIEKFVKAISTGGSIRRDEGLTLGSGLTLGNSEGCLIAWRNLFSRNGINTCQGGRLLAQGALEALKCGRGTLDLNGHTEAIIEHKADQMPA